MKIIVYALVFGGLLFGSCSSKSNSNSITNEVELTQTIAETTKENVLTIEELRLKVNESSFAIDQLEDEIEVLLKKM